jgi:hypothetical protein
LYLSGKAYACEVVCSNTLLEDYFLYTIHLDQSIEEIKSLWMYFNPGREDFVDN